MKNYESYFFIEYILCKKRFYSNEFIYLSFFKKT